MHQHLTKEMREEESLNGESIYTPEGLVGFPQFHQYTLLPLMNATKPGVFWQLQAEECQDIKFVLLNAEILEPNLKIEGKDMEESLIQHRIQTCQANLKFFYITTINQIAGGLKQFTVNVRAPLIIDVQTHQAWQIILRNSKYPIRYPLS